MQPIDVRALRAKLNWSQDDMAQYLWTNRSSISHFETHLKPRGPALKLLQQLAADLEAGRISPKPPVPRRPRKRSSLKPEDAYMGVE